MTNVDVISPGMKRWFRAALVRSAKTVAQTAVATIGTTAVIEDVNWLVVGSASALAGILSLLTSVGGIPEADEAPVAHSLGRVWK